MKVCLAAGQSVYSRPHFLQANVIARKVLSSVSIETGEESEADH